MQEAAKKLCFLDLPLVGPCLNIFPSKLSTTVMRNLLDQIRLELFNLCVSHATLEWYQRDAHPKVLMLQILFQ